MFLTDTLDVKYYRITDKGIYILFLVLTALALNSCMISNVVDVTFTPQDQQTRTASNPSLGLSTAATSQTSGQYRLEGNIGNQAASLIKENGAYKLYGGIQGEIISR